MKSSHLTRTLFYLITVMFLTGSAVFATDTLPEKGQVPGYFRMPVGDVVVTALYDGYIDMNMGILKNAPEEDIRSLLERGFVDPAKVRLEVTAFVVDTGKEKILVDAGTGTLFGPTVGKVPDSLAAAGFKTDDIRAVMITHMHPDHTGGLVDAEGAMRFKNATVYCDKKESAFWLSQENLDKASEHEKSFFNTARLTTAPYRAAGAWKPVDAGATLIGGIKAMPASGHTPGHTVYELTSGSETLWLMGDTVHCLAAQLPRPEIRMTFDINPDLAIATRKDLFDRAAQNKLWVGACHLPYPGLGKLRKEDTGGYSWIPAMFSQGR